MMGLASYKIVIHEGGWGVMHDGETAGPYKTKEAAYEAAVAAGGEAAREGFAVEINVPGRDDTQTI